MFRFPEIPTKVAGSAIVDGILKEKRIFSVPSHMMVVTAFIRYKQYMKNYVLLMFQLFEIFSIRQIIH